jgi:anaerobic selenocysteine-containing dehydrogenase
MMPSMAVLDETRTAYRTCPLCEATCGLEITVRRDQRGDQGTEQGTEQVVRIRGDRDDVFSKGFICPKGSTLKQLHDDPDRLRRPLVRRDGRHVEVSWEEAWSEVAARLGALHAAHGRESVAVYLGNPAAHSLAAFTHGRLLIKALGTPQVYSASTLDQMPRQVAAGLVFGTPLSVPVPDLDRTDQLVIIGANPYASNGSLATAPDWPGRIEALQARGGTVVVVDPRRTRTAEQADRWLAVRPGSDPLLLAAVICTLAEEDLIDPGDHVRVHLAGLDEAVAACRRFTPDAVAGDVGVDAAEIRRLARELAAAPAAVVYGRIGTTTAPFGTLTSWLIDVVNTATGNLDRPGGAMFPTAAAGAANTRGEPGRGSGFRTGRRTSRVSGHPEVMGELPAAALVEEIVTPGPGQVRALVTFAGNPVLSSPNGPALERALDDLELMISIDVYLNETTRHADVVLPVPSPLQKDHYDLALYQLALHNVANYSEPVLDLDEGQPDEWEVLARLAMIAQGFGPDADPAPADDLAAATLARAAVSDAHSPMHGRDVDEVLAELGDRRGPARLLDLQLRSGPYRLTLEELRAHPHGIDLGPLVPRIPEMLRTPSGRVELAPAELVADLARLWDTVGGESPGMVLVGRRHLRSNNSWMHNLPVLVKGAPRCTLMIHPTDARQAGLVEGGTARVVSRVGSVDAIVEVTEGIRPGVVSLPHGWGHGRAGARLTVAAAHAGVNSNVLTDPEALDPLSGTAVLNGIPVTVTAI